MSVDKQRVQAVELLNSLGYRWTGLAWEGSAPAHALHVEADALHGLLMEFAGELAGCLEETALSDKLDLIGEALEAYEQHRWPDGRIPGGNG